MVAPKRAALAEATKRLDASNRKLQGIRAKVKELSDKVAGLEADLIKVEADEVMSAGTMLRRPPRRRMPG